MNLELLRTFLEIAEAGTFVKAAERLHVTQSTVSMRIRALEETLGRTLFVRGGATVELTPAGERLRHYAQLMLRVWQQTRQDIAMPERFHAMLTVGGQFSLWDRLILRWLPWMRAAAPGVKLQAEVADSASLMWHLAEALIDIGVMYNPQSRPGLVVERLLVEKLILVTTSPDGAAPADSYVLVDWGPDFRRAHSEAFPDMEAPAVTVDLGTLGLQYILENGGAGYFPSRVLRGLVADRRLHTVAGAPEFDRPAYMVYPARDSYEAWFGTALAGLRHVAAMEAEV